MTSVRTALITLVFAWIAVLIALPLGGIIHAAIKPGFPALLEHILHPQHLHALSLTLVITITSVMVNAVFGTMIALVLARQNFPLKPLLEEAVNLPHALSPVIAGFMFVLLLGPNGALGSILSSHGVPVIFALPGMIIVTIFTTLPFTAKEIIPVLRSLGTDQEDAAISLGASPMKTFMHITLPSIRWGLVYGIMLIIARSLGEFGAVLVVSGSIIGLTQTATLHIHQEFTDFHFESAFAASLVLAALSVFILAAMEIVKKRLESKGI